MNQIITVPFGEYALSAALFSHTATVRKGCIFYYHGGGLVFGTSDDLPALYINAFNRAGYDLISLSYPLAPESPLPQILDAAFHGVMYLLERPRLLGYDTMPPYVLFGRSAGAYLALMTASRLRKNQSLNPEETAADKHLPLPCAVLSFYGYHTFDIPEFKKPNTFYQKLPAVPERIITQMTGSGFLTEGPKETRYSLYIYARQTGTWTDLLNGPTDMSRCCLTDEDLSQLPPGFFTASSSDQDVPFRISKYMASKIPGSTFKPVYYLEHDFDRDTRRKEGLQVYDAAIAWLDKLLF